MENQEYGACCFLVTTRQSIRANKKNRVHFRGTVVVSTIVAVFQTLGNVVLMRHMGTLKQEGVLKHCCQTMQPINQWFGLKWEEYWINGCMSLHMALGLRV